jgi:hypothetical protein
MVVFIFAESFPDRWFAVTQVKRRAPEKGIIESRSRATSGNIGAN